MKKIGIMLVVMVTMIVANGCSAEALKDTDAEVDVAATDNTEKPVEVAAETEPDMEEEEVVEEVVEPTPQEKMISKLVGLMDEGKAFDAGSYVQGDVPKGEYAFISFDGSGLYV